MTFTEAALEVLRSAGEPLHYKRITELAIERNLLSHIGKTPEITMSSRLATMVKKDRGHAPIIKVKPGVFTLRDPNMSSEQLQAAIDEVEREAAGEADGEDEAVEKPAVPLPGADVFPEEEGDDDPILAGLEQEAEDGEGRGGRSRRRRRRRRGGRGEAGDSGDEGPGNGEPREAARDGGSPGRERTHDRGRDRDRDRNRERASRPREDVALDFGRVPEESDLLGMELADAVLAVLQRSDLGPTDFVGIANELVRRGRLSGSGHALAPTIAAALRADCARAALRHDRQRFRLRGQRVSLREWALPRDLVQSEENVDRQVVRQREQARRAFVSAVNELPAAGFAELVATWLNAEGVTALRAVRRPGSSNQEFHFAGTLRRGPEENRLAIVVQRGGRDISRETVIDVRGSLHNYGSATGAWLITTGRVMSGAREEQRAEGAAPIALFDGAELAASMERHGIGMKTTVIAMSEIDFELLEGLGLRERAERPRPQQGRDRDRGRPAEGARAERARGEAGSGATIEGDETGAAAPAPADTGEGEPQRTDGSEGDFDAAQSPDSPATEADSADGSRDEADDDAVEQARRMLDELEDDDGDDDFDDEADDRLTPIPGDDDE